MAQLTGIRVVVEYSDYRNEWLAAELTAAKAQVQQYVADEHFIERTRAATVHCLARVFHGWELKAKAIDEQPYC